MLDLRAYGGKRQFFRHRADADAERKRQLITLGRHGREAVGLPQREMSHFITAKKKLAEYGETINDAVNFRVDYLERARRHGITAKQLSDEAVAVKRRMGFQQITRMTSSRVSDVFVKTSASARSLRSLWKSSIRGFAI